MDFEDIVIGSGLSALGAVIGLAHSRSVLVLAGPATAEFQYYDERRAVPCAYLGQGGLGTAWHGVIPTGLKHNFAHTGPAAFSALFAHFYPRTPVQARVGQPTLFVPWRAIRPPRELARLQAQRGERLRLLPLHAEHFKPIDGGVEVLAQGQRYSARRLWLAAGALHTPGLVDRSVGRPVSRATVSDHITCYIGLTEAARSPQVERSRDGLFFPATYDAAAGALYTLRPAHFAFRTLDHAIETRAVFGLPTGNAIAKIARRASPALVAEAFYNRFGLFAKSRTYSVMAQVPAPDAYERNRSTDVLTARPDAMRRAAEAARAGQPFIGVQMSRRPELYIPGIHLHHSLDTEALHGVGIDHAGSPIQVIDASTLRDIGPDHHSFKMMLRAAERASQAVPAET